jgi:hypothetical protein
MQVRSRYTVQGISDRGRMIVISIPAEASGKSDLVQPTSFVQGKAGVPSFPQSNLAIRPLDLCDLARHRLFRMLGMAGMAGHRRPLRSRCSTPRNPWLLYQVCPCASPDCVRLPGPMTFTNTAACSSTCLHLSASLRSVQLAAGISWPSKLASSSMPVPTCQPLTSFLLHSRSACELAGSGGRATRRVWVNVLPHMPRTSTRMTVTTTSQTAQLGQVHRPRFMMSLTSQVETNLQNRCD